MDEYAGNADLERLVDELDMLFTRKKELDERISELKNRIFSEMQDSMLTRCASEHLRIKVEEDYKINIERAVSDKVYDALERHGYACTKRDSVLRAKYINDMLKDDGELPPWLLGMVRCEEKNSVSVTWK